eukprot:Phypoly_transcript_06981.p1 GENE.Phypoly_transcript_06981~~Phypoly_transcript_06981.p1  ORF type:complete len:484 (+),score=74.49 Phypoly_transcript_06981:173-1624(+)
MSAELTLRTPVTPDGDEKEFTPEEKPVVEQKIEEIGMGFFQYRVFAICGLFFFADVMEVMFLTYLKIVWKADKDVSSWWSAALGTSVFGGMLVGASFWGIIADKYGRKVGLACVSVLISLLGLASAFSPNVQTLVVLRACVGFGLGGSHIAVTLVMEVVPPSIRQTVLNFFLMFTFLAVWTEAGLAWAFMDWLGWQAMALLTCAPSFLSVLFIYWIPESPLWLTVTHKPLKAATILQQMVALNKSPVHIDEEKLAAMADTPNIKHDAADVKLLFSRHLWMSTICIWLVWFGDSMIYYGLMLITPDYLAESGTGYVYRDIFITTLSECPALILVFILVKTVGAKNAQAIYFIGSGVLTVVIASVKSVETQFLAILMSLLIRFFTAGSLYCTYLLTPAIYPTNIRSVGFGAGSSMSRVGGMITPFVANLADPKANNGLLIPCLVYAVTALVGMLAGFALNFTTRNSAKGKEALPLLHGHSKDVEK